MKNIANLIDRQLLDDWQRDFPITQRPFSVLGTALGIDEADVLARLERMLKAGRISRVGATCAPNAVAASTLAALAAPEDRIDSVSDIIGAEPGVNHSYLREDRWNFWFVATGPDRAHVNATLKRIEAKTGLQVLDLRLVRPFNIDLGFSMSGRAKNAPRPAPRIANSNALQQGDRDILQMLTRGLPIVRRPFAKIGDWLGRREDEILQRVSALHEAAIISRFGVIVRHRSLGWSSNAMVVWQMEPEMIDIAGPKLADFPGITLCYERKPAGDAWPYRLYCMIHGRSRSETLDTLEQALSQTGLADVPRKVLFSTRCLKQTGAMISDKSGVAA